MQVSNLRRSLLLQIAIILGASGTTAQQKVLWQAEVIPERLNVYVQVSIQHEVTMQLNRGAIVNVVLEIAVLGDQWCRISLPDHSEPEGYTLCAGLKPVSPAERQNSRVEPVVLRRQQTVSTSIAIPTPPTAATKPGMLSNKDITDMVASGLPEAVVVAKIKSTGCEFDTAPATLKALKTNGVPDSVVLAMVEAPAGQPKVTKVAEVPVTTAASVDRQTTSSDGKVRVLVTDSQSWEMRGGSSAGGNSNGWGASSSFSGGARPQTAEIIKTLNERCPEVTVTNRLDKADFV
ncbi:MAG TPA: hypothetical protein VN037_11295, partial [Verrucomicrobiae bacterium]|nr:hypothetical protein [Verrucomicrobiae bacterium]